MKADQRLGRDLHLLSARDPVDAGANAAPGDRPDGCALPAAQKTPENSAHGGSPSGLLCRIFSSAIPLLGERIRHHIHWMVNRIDACELNRQLRTAGKVSG